MASEVALPSRFGNPGVYGSHNRGWVSQFTDGKNGYLRGVRANQLNCIQGASFGSRINFHQDDIGVDIYIC